MEPKRTGADGYGDLLGRGKPPKGERAALLPYLQPDEVLHLREPAEVVGEAGGLGAAGGRELLRGSVVILVSDRKLLAARTSGGFRPRWEVFTLPYGHLEPGISLSGTVSRSGAGGTILIPTSGRRAYYVELGDSEAAGRLVGSLGGALRAYRRDRMGLDDE